MEKQFQLIQYVPLSRQLSGSKFSRGFYDLMTAKRSIREFSTEPVDIDLIKKAIATAGTAPGGANKQPWYFAVVTDGAIKKSIQGAAESVEYDFYNKAAPREWLNDLQPFGTNHFKPYLSQAPVLIGIFARTNVESNENSSSKTYYPVESTCIATGLLISSLHVSGLCTLTHTPRPLGFLNEILNLDNSYKPIILLVVGYASVNAMVPNLKRKELCEIMKIY